jgi:hypothetical protein
MSLDAQTEFVAANLVSPAAKAFLEKQPPVEQLMPKLSLSKVEKLAKQERRHGYLLDYDRDW